MHFCLQDTARSPRVIDADPIISILVQSPVDGLHQVALIILHQSPVINIIIRCSYIVLSLSSYIHVLDVGLCVLARDAFVRRNRRAIAMMFVCLSVCLSRSVHCDYSLQCSGDPVTKACPPTPNHLFFQFHLEERWGMDVQTRRDISRTVSYTHLTLPTKRIV